MPALFYEDRLRVLKTEQQQLLKRKRTFGILRLGNIVVLITALYFLWNIAWWGALLAALVLLLVFTRLIYKDLANQEALDTNRRLIKINENELQALGGNYFQFADGKGYLPKEHFYANDLDIFGHASLFQYTNRTISEPGANLLANWLLQPANTDHILKRQEAAKELSSKPLWMQLLCAYGNEHPIRDNTVKNFENWLQQPTLFLQFRHWQWIRYVLPVIAVGITLLVIFSYLPLSSLYTTLFLMGVVAFQINKILAPVHNQLSRMVDEMETFSASIGHVEKEQFNTAFLQQLQQAFIQANNATASQKISHLKNILEKLDMRYNLVMAAPLNLLLQWNLQQVLELEKWKTANKETVLHWFDALAHFEALNSFAYLQFNHPQWATPVIHDQHFYIKAKELGHPLIKENRRVNNFIDIKNNNSIMLVTGSNMAGKSTYLRSVGINVVLAMAGATVCARSLELSPVQLLSSMRITDNLEESTSTFYAELKKLKAIIDKVNKGEKVFILLDEILRGTNSLDRHTGSVALIKQLIRHHAPTIIATHDIALADLQKEFQQNIYNFHFDVQVNNEELYFDYKLKPGICQSLNASVLMKKIGIEGV
ncbi:MAG: hypothetical protein WAT19_14875 [Ferruginibacter sp.]